MQNQRFGCPLFSVQRAFKASSLKPQASGKFQDKSTKSEGFPGFSASCGGIDMSNRTDMTFRGIIPTKTAKHQRFITLGAVLAFLASGPLALCADKASAASEGKGVQITQLADRLHVEINGRLFTEYFFKDVPRPYCYPVIGPGGAPMTRNWPMKSVPDQEPDANDHKHHRSLWFAHGDINGYDFWSEDKKFGKTVHERFDEVRSGADFGVIKSHNKWIAPDGKLVCTDDRTIRIYNTGPADERMIDFDITLHAADGAVTFGD